MKYLIAFLTLALLLACNNNKINSIDNHDHQLQEPIPCNNLQHIDSLISKDSLNGLLFSCRAEYYFNVSDFANALYDINKALELNGKNVNDLLLLSDIFFMLGNIKLSNDAILEAQQLDVNNYVVYYALGKHNFRIGNFDMAKNFLLKSIQIHPLNPKSYFVLGQMAALSNDTIAAIQYYQNAIQSDYKYCDAYLQLAVINMDKNKYLVPQYLENILSIEPQNSKALFLLGVYYYNEEDYYKSKKYFHLTNDIDSNHKMACYNLGYIYLTEMQLFDSAAFWFNKAFLIDPSFIEAEKLYKYSLTLLE